MPTIGYAPQTIDSEELDAAIELDTEFIVNGDGTVQFSGRHVPAVSGYQEPEDPTIENDPSRWEFFSRGYTGQHGYPGPEMHESECLGGQLAADILATPGTYALVGVRYECEPVDCKFVREYGSCPDSPLIGSRVVLRAVDQLHTADPEKG